MGTSGVVDDRQARQIALEAYLYLYPLVTMETTRRQATNAEPGTAVGRGPMMTFTHVRAFPTADFRDVVRPNFDTLYSAAWLDLTAEPAVVSVPDAGDRYYLLPMLDMWTDVFACPGTRTTGNRPGRFVVVPPGWTGTLPHDLVRIDAPTPYVWVVGRTQTNGPADYAGVHAFQDGLRVAPLSRSGSPVEPPPVAVDPAVDMETPPLRQVEQMTGTEFFARAAEVLRRQPPHVTDHAVLARMRRIGLDVGGEPAPAVVERAADGLLDDVPAAALAAMSAALPRMARVVNGWQLNTDTMGVYGNDYLKRAIVTMIGLGANPVEDAIYPLVSTDDRGEPLDGTGDYVLHFEPAELPPAHAFWSVTLYDTEGFQVANPLGRFALGDRDPLAYGEDGSLDLYVQHADPGEGRRSNWLPAPAGPFNLTARLYWPEPQALDGRWVPPGVRRTA